MVALRNLPPNSLSVVRHPLVWPLYLLGEVSETEAVRSRSDQQIHDACQQINHIFLKLEAVQPDWLLSQQ